MSTERYEMPHPLADQCEHAGVGKACQPCRERLDFTEAASDAANERYGTAGNRQVWLDAAEWARTHLAAQEPRRKTVLDYWDERERARAAQEPTDAEVEAAALVICIDMDGPDGPPETKACKACVNTARRALRAARRDEEKR